MTTERKRRLKPYDAVEFKNGNHVLKPGDAAIAVTTCTSRGYLRVGRYLGVRKSSGHYGGTSVVMEVHDKRTLFVDKNDEPYDYDNERKEIPYPQGAPRPNYSLRWGTPEWHAAQDQYKKDYQTWQDTVYAEYQAKLAKRREGYSNKEFPYVWITNLQNNNIYPAGIALVDVTL